MHAHMSFVRPQREPAPWPRAAHRQQALRTAYGPFLTSARGPGYTVRRPGHGSPAGASLLAPWCSEYTSTRVLVLDREAAPVWLDLGTKRLDKRKFLIWVEISHKSCLNKLKLWCPYGWVQVQRTSRYFGTVSNNLLESVINA